MDRQTRLKTLRLPLLVEGNNIAHSGVCDLVLKVRFTPESSRNKFLLEK